MSGRQHTSADRQRAHRAGQQSIRRRCKCGPRVFVGNAAWHSHLAAAERRGEPGHGYTGRA